MDQWQQFQVMPTQWMPIRGTILITMTSSGWKMPSRKAD